MSDIREAFEAWADSFAHDSDQWEDMGRDKVFAAGYKAALQSQTAPAVPEGDKALAKIIKDAHMEGQKSATGREGTEFRWLNSDAKVAVDNIITAAPQPDHSPDAGKVVQPDPVPYDKHERECGKLIDERDHAQDWADKLAGAIGEHFGIDIGEHSNCNCPWETAFDNMPDAPAADGGEVEPADDSSTVYRIGDLGNQIRNLGCLQKHNEEMANSLAELAHQAWVLQRDVMRELTATHPTQPRNEVHKLGQELYEAARCLGCAQSDGNPDATEYWSEKSEAILSRLRSNGGGA